ncbi:Bug family tripartite tricarboxylate transporter substrate binding protein [Humitalea sp. 24SJ18S-53]|uniref:Bug family tripartite tricarboxylate transporter substrate binding protein n=1 Tax=Humitalea sp. 24SJ18S-53 TaxID=3422307 RepID=UPI003D674CCD
MRRPILPTLACLAALLLLLPGGARAQSWPARPVHLLINTTPGGAVDTVARLMAQRLHAVLGQPVVAENRAGGNGVVAGIAVQTAAPDGYTLLFGASIHALTGAIMRRPPYDPLADFTPVARVAEGPLLVVTAPRLPYADLSSLVDAVRGNPAGFAFATSSLGAAGHLAVLALRQITGVDVPLVSYRGSAPALTDLAAGTVQVMVDPILSSLPLVQGGQLRALAITAAARSPAAPAIPTVAEAGFPALRYASWYAVWGPRGLPEAVTMRLHAALGGIVAEDAVARRLAELGFTSVAESQADFVAVQTAEAERGAALLRQSGFEPQ